MRGRFGGVRIKLYVVVVGVSSGFVGDVGVEGSW